MPAVTSICRHSNSTRELTIPSLRTFTSVRRRFYQSAPLTCVMGVLDGAANRDPAALAI